MGVKPKLRKARRIKRWLSIEEEEDKTGGRRGKMVELGGSSEQLVGGDENKRKLEPAKGRDLG